MHISIHISPCLLPAACVVDLIILQQPLRSSPQSRNEVAYVGGIWHSYIYIYIYIYIYGGRTQAVGSSFRALSAVAAARSLNVHELEVSTAFLNGDLNAEIWMRQPQGYKSKTRGLPAICLSPFMDFTWLLIVGTNKNVLTLLIASLKI
ncbi:hypothetical protein VaNZ11_005118 [Volvox africanus]|uniref:Reverse transcriptase Ty1/copia-type domain-containing protein n=1 Tax=Volvox africanus TaxID=51714 RepID=A0ABQ5RY12_9CHLO|nr:hypothetical protein VaNZ11_005118 [Volvox africanus]